MLQSKRALQKCWRIYYDIHNTHHWFDPNSFPKDVCNAKFGVWLNFLVANHRQVNNVCDILNAAWSVFLSRLAQKVLGSIAAAICFCFLFMKYKSRLWNFLGVSFDKRLPSEQIVASPFASLRRSRRLLKSFEDYPRITRTLPEHRRPVSPYNTELLAFIPSLTRLIQNGFQ